jgi:DNA-binding NtrC family response regulator
MPQPSNKPVLLVIEDDPTTSDLICHSAFNAGFLAVVCPDVASAKEANWAAVSAVLLDLELPDGDGLDLLSQTRKKWPRLPFFILTSRDSAEIAVAALKTGAADYFTKPFDPTLVFAVIAGAIAEPLRTVKKAESNPAEWRSVAMKLLHEQVTRCADQEGAVLLLGEPGTGKRTLARWIHLTSRRSGRTFATLDAGSLDDQAATIELRGGDFPQPAGRFNRTRGKIEMTHGGSLFIQDIDRLSMRLQGLLIDSLEERDEPGHPGKSDFRLIASARCDLREGVDAGSFREDLYYRLSSSVIRVPAVREALQDLPVWCNRILTEVCLVNRCRLPVFTRGAKEAMAEYSWPGNLDELRREIERAVGVCGGGLIGEHDLSEVIITAGRRPAGGSDEGLPGLPTIRGLERNSLISALDSCGGNRRRAAKRLGVSLRTIYNMIARHGLGGRIAGGKASMSSAGREDRVENRPRPD